MFSTAALQGRTEYGPRVCVDKGRARCRRGTGPTSLRQPPRPSSHPQKIRPIVLQLANRIANVIQRKVRGALLETAVHLRRPAAGKFLQRAHIEIAVMEIPFEL